MAPGPMRIIVAGAGIAGLTSALAFAARGFPVRVFERAAAIEEAGAGIQLSPNGRYLVDTYSRPAKPAVLAVREGAG